MKKALIVLLCVVYFATAAPLWVRDDTLSITSNKWRSVYAIDDSTVWIVGNCGTAKKRTDGVHSHCWVDMSASLPDESEYYHLNDVFFINANTGWIVGECRYDTTVGSITYKEYQGVLYKTTDSGSSWLDQTPQGFDDPPTPFLKVQFASGSDGYITCGNGIVIKTADAGQTWDRTASDPWSDSNNQSVWYCGLGVVDASNLWVSGDAYGILSKSTNGGQSWTTYQPAALAQTYNFPGGGVAAPYGTRLANFGMDLIDMNKVKVGLSNGKVAVTTNGGVTWSVENWESQPVWFQDIAVGSDSSFYGVGTYRVANKDGTHEHNMFTEYHRRAFSNAPLYSVDISQSAGDFGYAVGQEYSVLAGYCPIVIQRYDPVGFVYDSTFIAGTYMIVRWHTTFERNTLSWKVFDNPMSPMYKDVSAGNISAADSSDDTIDYEYSIPFANPDFPYSYISIYLYTKDPQYNPPYFLMHGPEQVSTGVPVDSLIPAPSSFSVEDRANDEGGALVLNWSRVDSATVGYWIGRSEHANGPFWHATGVGSLTTTWTDTLALQNGKSYYYIIQANDGFARDLSAPEDTICGIPLDNIEPDPPDFTTSGCYLDTSSNRIRLEWDPVPDTADVAAYWVCPILPGASDYTLNHSSPIDRTVYHIPVDPAWQGWCVFYVAAMDYSGNISEWGGPCSIYVATNIDTSSSDKATAYNNGRKMVRHADVIWVCYESSDSVYVKKSSDNGATWSSRMRIGKGCNPCIGLGVDPEQEVPSLGVAWRAQGTADTIYFSKYNSGTSWSTPAAIVTSTNDLGPPSIVIDGDDYCYLTYQDNTTVKYTRFDIDRCNAPAPDSVGQGTGPSIGHMDNASGYPEVHVVWEAASSVKYRSKTLASGWGSSTDILANGKRPFIEIVGTVAHIVCDSSGADIWHSKTEFSERGESQTTTKLSSTSPSSKYATITNGNACAWVEELSGNREIYYCTYDAETGWSENANISETSENSGYPAIAEKQTVSSTKLFFLWTENDDAPYDITFRWQILDDNMEAGDSDLPFYVAHCGEDEPTGFTVHRDGYIQYGKEPHERIDYGNEYLEYAFEMFDTSKSYALAAYVYHEKTSAVPITIQVDDLMLGVLTIPSNQLVVHKEMVPRALLEDGALRMKIYGNDALSAIIAFYEYEREATTGTGGPQVYSEEQTAGKLTLQMQNPIVRSALVKYVVPAGTDARMKIYDVTGALRREINLSGQLEGQILWDGRDNIGRRLAAGIYFCRLETTSESVTEKVIFLR